MSNARGMRPSAVEIQNNYTMQIAYDVSSNPEYIGKANPGTAVSASGWQIRKITYSGSNITKEEWANGTDGFDKVWDSRATYSYS